MPSPYIYEQRQGIRNPKGTIPICKIEQIGPYGLFFAYRKGDTRPAPGTNYLDCMTGWSRIHLDNGQGRPS